MDYIDTQGITAPSTGKPCTDIDIDYSPMVVKKMTVFTDVEKEELKQIFREVLDEYS
tara:strand:- start:879 stop:1049 length:171 start_codon:yes stop_codon:yes gene_type:complete